MEGSRKGVGGQEGHSDLGRRCTEQSGQDWGKERCFLLGEEEVGPQGCEAWQEDAAPGFGTRLAYRVCQHRVASWGWQAVAWSVGTETRIGEALGRAC